MDEMIKKDRSIDSLIKLMFVIIAELLDLGTAETLRRDETVQKPVREFAAAHEFEEKMHRVYFRKLFEEVWNNLPSDLKQRIGVLLPEVFISLLGLDQEMARKVLAAFPDEILAPDEIVRIIDEEEKVQGSIRKDALEVLSFLEAFGAFDDPKVCQAFRSHNLMPDSFGYL
jgi:hypothetical protein